MCVPSLNQVCKTPNGGQERDGDPDGHGLFSLIDGAMSQTESLDLVGNG